MTSATDIHDVSLSVATAEIAPPTASRSPADYVELCDDARQRALRLLREEIDFIDNPSFHDVANETEIETTGYDFVRRAREVHSTTAPRDLPPHLARLCESPLLTHEEEQNAFRLMNFLKYRANSTRVKLDPDALDVVALEYAEADLELAREVRDHIVRANMRLVISVVKKFVTPQISFDDLLSEGIETMMNAVDKFDFDRGFRFSTYAYRSIARHAYRVITDRQKETSRFMTGSEDIGFESAEGSIGSTIADRAWNQLRRLMSQMIHRLDRREQFILRGRYALGAHRKVRSFQCLADKLGISKERVRQLESRAVKKLKMMATEHDPDNMVEFLSLN